MLLCFKLEKDVAAKKYIEAFKVKLEQPANIVNLPFSKKRLYQKKDVYALQIVPMWPEFYKYGYFFLGLCYIFGWPSWAYGIGVSFLAPGLFYQPWFYQLVLWLNLRKAGYRKGVKRVSDEEFFEVVLWDR